MPPAPTSVSVWVDIALAATMPMIVLGVIATRLWTDRVVNEKPVRGRGLGGRTIQFLAVGLIVPVVGILALHERLQGDAVAAIFGGMIGYLLGSISKFNERD